MPSIVPSDLERMRGKLLFDGPDAGRKLTTFWTLLSLSTIIAAAGVVSDSTATVIGAMIVAPLMTPILGTVLSVVVGDLRNLVRSVSLVAGGAVLVAGLAYLFGRLVPVEVTVETSSQVAGRVSPRLIDLVAALATGAVGAFALVREDVSDTLPGVAIAISLVPPLAVVGLTLEAGATSQASGALLLFVTNVGAILLSGIIVMSIFRVHRTAVATEATTRRISQLGTIPLVVVFVVVIAIPLAGTTARTTATHAESRRVADVVRTWADARSWKLRVVEPQEGGFRVVVAGPLPAPDPAALRAALDVAGSAGTDIALDLVPEEHVELPGR